MNLPILKSNSKESVKSNKSNQKESNSKVNIPKLHMNNINNNDSYIVDKSKSDSDNKDNNTNT